MRQAVGRRSSIDQENERLYLRGLCPLGCWTNHGGPGAVERLGAEWAGLPATRRPSWTDFLEAHGRRDLVASPVPVAAN